MKNLICKGKTTLAYIVAFAILSVSLFTGVVVTASAETNGTCGRTIVEKWDQYSDGAWSDWYDSTYEGGDGTKNNPYIISSAEELANLCRYGSDANVYYKVADDIKAFDMNTVSGVDLTGDNITAQQVKDSVAGKILGKVWFCDNPFKGNFDGNGVTIYGLYAGPAYYNQTSFENGSVAGCTRSGLFPKIDASTAVIKNIAIKNSYFKGDPAGAVFGETLGNGGSAAIENIVVANCYIDSTGGYVSGVIGGYCLYDAATNTADKIKVNNCLVYDNVVYNKDGTTPRLAGTMEVYCDNGSGSKVRDYNGFGFSNTIAIGCNVENTGSWWQKDPAFYANCYTTGTPAAENTTIVKLASADAAKGLTATEKLSGLDKSVWFFNTSGYPELRIFHNIKASDNNDGTHTEVCDCGLNSGATNHSFVEGVCACGATPKCGETISVYSGTPDTTSTLSGTGTQSDPYIIKTADQFAAIALGKRVYAQGSYFMVDPSIDAFYMNGGKTVAAMTSAADVKTYFETNGGFGWTSSWDNSTADKSFSGHFDGSGVTIYGLYDADYNSGLFEMAEDSSSFKNFALKNSYIKVGSGAGVAAIVGKVSKQTDADIMTFENMVVANNHIEQTNAATGTGASAVLGYLYNTNDGVKINNALIYGNNIVNPNTSATYGLVSVGGNGSAELTQITNVISLGVKPFTAGQGWYLRVLDGNKCFVNVYTDQDCSAMANYSEANKKAYNFKDNLTLADLQGAAAVQTADILNWYTTWITTLDGLPDLRVFHGDQLEISQVDYDGHKETCSCGLVTPVENHNYNKNYKCIDCLFVCDHANANVDVSGGDCITAATKTVICSCGYESVTADGTAPGHTFDLVEEVPSADCQTNGVAAHNHCIVCDKDYDVEASKTESFENALSADDLKLPVGEHTASEDEYGIIYDMNDSSHSKICSVCTEKFDTDNHIGDFVPDGSNGHKGQCKICKLGTSDEIAPHNFSGDVCTDCNWKCIDHNFVDGTESDDIISIGDCVTDKIVKTYCDICGIEGEQHVTTAPGHTEGDIKIENIIEPDCTEDGSHDEVTYCEVCTAEVSRETITDDKLGHTPGESWEENRISDCVNGDTYELVTVCSICNEEISRENKIDDALGHDFIQNDSRKESCIDYGWIAHTRCAVCDKYFAYDTTDKFSVDYISEDDIYTSVDDEAHSWIVIEPVEADCENGGTNGYSYCELCYLFVLGEEETKLDIDTDALWNELKPIVSDKYDEVRAQFVAENPEPDDDATEAEKEEFEKAFFATWNPIYQELVRDAYNEAIVDAAKENGVVFDTDATGHNIVKVDEQSATYDAEGVKEHYACDCGKLYSDAEGKNEVTAESLVIPKLVKVDDNTDTEVKDETDTDVEDETDTDVEDETDTDVEDETDTDIEDETDTDVEDETEGDTNKESPETKDSIASVLALTTLIAAAFITTKKLKNR